jgi:tetratricopeptide (TPR) repeat protein
MKHGAAVIHELIALYRELLRPEGLDPSARDIADTLWLAGQIAHAAEVPPTSQVSVAPRDQEAPLASEVTATKSAVESVAPATTQAPPATGAPEQAKPMPTAELHQKAPGTGGNRGGVGMTIRVPAAPALPYAREIGKALRPLRRRVPSRVRFVLDEAATAGRLAETRRAGLDIPEIVPRAAPDCWLDVALVVDQAGTMAPWQASITELRSVLAHLGAFRDVRDFRLITDAPGGVALHVGGSAAARRPCSVRELIDPRRTRLVLVVSDCAGRAWDNGQMAAMLGEWGRHGPVAVLQTLPERLWLRSGLGAATPVRLRSPGRGAPNSSLVPERISRSFPLQPVTGVPVLLAAAFDPASLRGMARLVAGAGGARARGVLLRESASSTRKPVVSGTRPTAEERVAAFQRHATPTVRRLASLLAAAAPLNLPVMRLVWKTMVPEATLGDLAEIFLGGLLYEEAASSVPSDAEAARYEFHDGTREILIGSAPVSAAAEVLERVSAYVNEHAGRPRDFDALLKGFGEGEGGPIAKSDRPFARIRLMMLRRLGGGYASAAAALEAQLRESEELRGGDAASERAQDDEAGSAAPVAPRVPASVKSPAPSVRVSIGRLPATGRELFGRERDLAWLDACWAGGVRVATIVAWGGVGKSALVNTWLRRVSEDAWRGAERVFAWSFYSQGTSEHRASSDEFFAVALREFGDTEAAPTSQWEKGERLAKLVRRERAILVLDGLEPLQWGPGVQEGRLKDQAMEALLKELAGQNQGMCVVTTRIKVAELDGWAGAKVQERELGGLSDEAGAELLRARKAKGTEEELQQASRDYEGHGLALTLLGSYVHKAHRGDIRKRDRVALLDGKPAQRMFATYEKWFAGKPEVGVLRVLGLFDRPASEGELAVLRAQPRIPGLTSFLYGAGPHAWDSAVATLRDVGLVVGGSEEREALDAHPLVREYFGEQLKKAHPAGWKEGHRRLYEYLKGKAEELPETIEEMAPLYAAVVHGCMAGKNQEALVEVWLTRIQRHDEHFNRNKLGAFSSEAAFLSAFFEFPWEHLAPGLGEREQAWVLNAAGFALRALGRLPEATDMQRLGLKRDVARQDWLNAAISASNLSELLQMRGELREAEAAARESVAHADRSGDAARRMIHRTTLAAVLHALGRGDEAAALFEEAEQMQKVHQPAYPLLYSLQGFRYCDILLDQGREVDVLARAARTLEWVRQAAQDIVSIAVDHLSLGRAHHLIARSSTRGASQQHIDQAGTHLQRALEGLRRAGAQEMPPRGLLARAALYIHTSNLSAARRDLTETLSLSQRCGFRLHEADAHLGLTHLALAEHDPAAARHHLAAARAIITATSYHRRDAELVTLEAEAEAMSAEVSRQARQAGRQERKKEESSREPSDPLRSSRALAPLRETPASAPESPSALSPAKPKPKPKLPTLPPPLLDAYRERRLAILFGSGLSLAKDVTGNFPGWWDLPGRLLDLAEKQAIWSPAQIQSKRDFFKDYVSLETMLAELDTIKGALGGARGYRTALASLFRPANAAPGAVHRAIASLGVDAVLTTNYDRLYETADPARIAYTWLKADKALHDIQSRSPVLLKIHGTAEDADSVVLTRAEYDKAAADASFRDTMRFLLQGHTFLLVGYGINDPLDLDLVFGLNRSTFGTTAQRHYALMPESVSGNDRARWDREMNIRVLPYDDGDLPAILQALGRTTRPALPERPAPGVQVSIGRLPATGRELFGREKELAWLDACWRDGVHVATLVAFGGVGKSALVNAWLARVRDEGWRGAERVFGWSFYIQGTERLISSDEFFAVALRWFGDTEPGKGSAWDKGERLARLVGERRGILVLDGLEALQWGPGVQAGRLKDQAMAALLKELGAQNRGICLVTTRIDVADLEALEGEKVQAKALEHLSVEAGAELLKARGVKGTEEELREATNEYKGHGLALTLLGSYLEEIANGDVRRRKEIGPLEADERVGGHARRVMAAYEPWLSTGPELAILLMIGLFDRPADADEIAALRAEPVVPGLTDGLAGVDGRTWNKAAAKLRQMGLLAAAHGQDRRLDAHPLVREHFGEQLRKAHPKAWREGHRRLYAFLKGKAKELPETIEEMAPLYAAVVHGCLAGKNQEALDEVFFKRINRGNEFFSTRTLGAFHGEAAALSAFFDPPWERLAPGLSEPYQAWVLAAASFALRALGRLPEATDTLRLAARMSLAREDWKGAAIQTSNLGELLQTRGELRDAEAAARESVAHVGRSGDAGGRMVFTTTLATALHALGRRDEAAALFEEAEQAQKESQPRLYSLQGFRFCDLLLDQGQEADVLARAAQTLKLAVRNGWLLDIALDHLSLGRAHHLATRFSPPPAPQHHTGQAAAHLQQAVDGLRRAGYQDFLPLGLLARAAHHLHTGDHPAARHDLDEVLALATRCGFRLHEADAHLGLTRLALAEADLPAAHQHLAAARSIITGTSYHRRDPDLAALSAEIAARSAGPA